VKLTADDHDHAARGFERQARAHELLADGARSLGFTVEVHDAHLADARDHLERAFEHRHEAGRIREAEHDELVALRQAVWRAHLEAMDLVPNFEEDDYAAGAVLIVNVLPSPSPHLCDGCGSTADEVRRYRAGGARACCPDDTTSRLWAGDFDQTAPTLTPEER
jgi:hypothetical protein